MAGAARLRTRYRRYVSGRKGAPASGPEGSVPRLALKGAEQSDRSRLDMRRQRVAEPPRFKAERREALEAAEQILKIRPHAARDGYRNAKRRVNAPATRLNGSKMIGRYVRARREIRLPEAKGNTAQPNLNAKPTDLASDGPPHAPTPEGLERHLPARAGGGKNVGGRERRIEGRRRGKRGDGRRLARASGFE